MSPSPVATTASPVVTMADVVGVSLMGMTLLAVNEKAPLIRPLMFPLRHTPTEESQLAPLSLCTLKYPLTASGTAAAVPPVRASTAPQVARTRVANQGRDRPRVPV